MIFNVLQLLEKNASANSEKIALSDGTSSVTYGMYREQARRIGSYIIKNTSQTGSCYGSRPVAVLIDRNILSIITFMGVIYSGNFYVPVDASMPEERIKLIYQTLDPLMVIDARGRESVMEGAEDALSIIENTETDDGLLDAVRSGHIDTDPLYCIFTSGSTGVPKGVAVSHRSVLDLTEAFHDSFGFSEDLVFGNQAPFDFDVSVKDIYNALFNNARVEVIPKKLFKLPGTLVDYIREKHINTLIWAVSALRIVADFKTFGASAPPEEIRYIMFSGEVMPVKALNYWMDNVPGARYVNLYGPTEITCNCTYYEIKKRHEDDEMLPVGKAFKNTRVFLRDDRNQIISVKDQVGEICVSGTCLALGYWNNKERTDAAFLPDPVISAYPSRIYATGDMGYYNADGDIVFASRKDYQIKHMGHRIELGEVETALNAIPFVTVSCCIYDSINEKIVCFYQAESECRKEIVLALSKKLPKYMWPNEYRFFNEMPMNKNGKIDRVLLKKQIGEKKR
ncbi:MAG: amino acid adenylation domain-containing protein [Parasporobacterium sp.]|nr:amino acid adenylation domain-containing protein [Parasporobacterium sp.]